MQDNSARLAGADFIRAMACLGVMTHHIVQRLDPHALAPALRPLHAVLMMGSFGVGAFFVLSGYLLSRPFWIAFDKGAPMPSLGVYGLRRLVRIAPGFWVALTVSFVLSITLFAVPLDFDLVLRFVAGLTFLSSWHWLTLFPVEDNGPLWSIGFEVMSYLFLPACLVAVFGARRFGLRGWPARAVWLGAIALALAAHIATLSVVRIGVWGTGWNYGLVGGAREWTPEFNSFGFFAVFAIGALAGGVQALVASRRSALFDVLFLAGLGLSGWAVALSLPKVTTEGWGLHGIPYGFPLFPIGIALALAAAPSAVWIGRVTEAGFFRFVALVSFGLYVWHYLVLEIVRQTITPHYVFAGLRDVGSWAGLSAGALAVSLVLAVLSYRLIERPALDWERRLEKRRAATAAKAEMALSSSQP